MTLREDFEARRQYEQEYQVEQRAKQGIIYKSRAGYPYNVWLVENGYHTLNGNFRYYHEVLHPQGLRVECNRVYVPNEYIEMKDIEIAKNSRKGMEWFKDVNPNLPLAEQIQKKYGPSQNLFNEFAIIDSGNNISVYSKQTLESTPEVKTVDTPKEKDQYVLGQEYQAYFSRKQISHNRMIQLGDRQKEIELAHMFDDNILVIDGGPGTGKTSTMIQRLKLLISDTFYNDNDYKVEDFSNGTDLIHLRHIWKTFLKDKVNKDDANKDEAAKNVTWMFFSPTIQLNEFLKSSLSGEGLKFIDQSTKVWVNRSRKKSLSGYCIELARDKYHFIDSTPLKRENAQEYFRKSPISLYRDFENELLEQFKKDRSNALEKLNSLQKNIGIENPKDGSYLPISLENIFEYSSYDCKNTFDEIDKEALASKAFVKRMSEQLQDELYSSCFDEFLNDEGCINYRKKETTNSDALRNKIFARIILFWFVEKNNRKIFNEIFDTENELFEQYNALRDLIYITRLSDFKKGYCDTYIENCDKNDKNNQKPSFCINQPYKDLFKDATRTTMDVFLDGIAKKEGYPLSSKAYQTFFTSLKGAIARKAFDEKHKNTPWFRYFTEGLETGLKKITEKLIWVLIKNFVNNGNVNIGYDFQSGWFVTNEITKEWMNYREVEKARKDLYKIEDFDILFATTFRKVYDSFRQENGFEGPYKIQELSFQIFTANTLSKKLYKKNKTAYSTLVSNENDVVKTYDAAARIIIGIDESTDFTPVELAAMASLGHPEYSCITLAGDQMQAFNENGITNWSQLRDGIFFSPCSIMDLKLSYRQSRTLLDMAKKIYKRTLGKEAPYESYVTVEREPSPLLFKSNNRQEKIKWLANRINSIQKLKGYIPATAIFYPSADKEEINEFVEEMQDYIMVESCFVTSDVKVVVYPLSLVKGLEFEIAFFYDLDSIQNTEMQQRYLYVGLSRATFYLGATSSTSWNEELSNDFKTDARDANWPLSEDEQNSIKNEAVKTDANIQSYNDQKTEQNQSSSVTTINSEKTILTEIRTQENTKNEAAKLDVQKQETNKFQPISIVSTNEEKQNHTLNGSHTNTTRSQISNDYLMTPPINWAKKHGIDVKVVLKLLRSVGVVNKTGTSPVFEYEYKKIEKFAEEEKRKAEQRNKSISTIRLYCISDVNELCKGSRVSHQTYGLGTVVDAYGSGNNAYVEVRFDNYGLRCFQQRMALKFLTILR